ncbi:hypothetical protein E4U14_001318 [Claviceps sp. LM454 group G7]|nr:hypothetical protein E4U14_001318 [Claviceps sp. LM454 group G7]
MVCANVKSLRLALTMPLTARSQQRRNSTSILLGRGPSDNRPPLRWPTEFDLSIVRAAVEDVVDKAEVRRIKDGEYGEYGEDGEYEEDEEDEEEVF